MARYKPKSFLPFQEARRIVRKLGLKSVKEWRYYIKENRLEGMPVNPDSYYTDEWRNWADWLGTCRVAAKDKVFRSYSETRRWAQESGIKSDNQWREAVKADQIPNDIPRSPRLTNKNDWTTSGEFMERGLSQILGASGHHLTKQNSGHQKMGSPAEKIG